MEFLTGLFRRGDLAVGAESGARSQEINVVFSQDEGWTVVQKRKRKAPKTLQKDQGTKCTKKDEVATKKSNFCLRAPSQRTGRKIPSFQSPHVGPPQVFECVAPGRDSTSIVGSRSVVESGASLLAFGFGSSFVGPSLLEQHQSPDGSFLVSRGTSLRRCPPLFGARSTDGHLRARSLKAGLVGDAAEEVVPAGDVDVTEGVVVDTDFSERMVACVSGGGAVIGSTAGESQRITGLRDVAQSDTSLQRSCVMNSSGFGDKFACASVGSALFASASALRARSSLACLSDAVSAHARPSPMQVAHNSGGTGVLLPVQKATSYCLGNSWSDTGRVQGPTGRRCTKGGVSGPAEDLRPVTEVEAGVNFRPAGCVRGQVAGSLPGRQPGTGTRSNKGSVVTPSLHPEVPDSLPVSPGPGQRIRQLMGWSKVCGTAQSGIWVLKGNARTCMFPANLDHLRVGWRKQGSYKTAWVTPGHDCLCSYKYGHGAAVRPQTNKAIWDGVIGLWGRVAPFLSPWCGKKELPTGVNLNHYDGSRSCVRWHSDNESLFGPRDSPKLIVSLSLGNPVEFKVRRVSDSVTSSITLDHGDVLVMDGSAQSEYLHCTMPGLQGPRVNLTYRWVAQHTASCPLAGVVGCLLPSCVQGLAEPGSRFWEKRGK